MKTTRYSTRQKGQALTEMVLSIPILFLLAAGIIHFAVLFLSDVQFEHACGEAARQYAAGIIDKNSLAPQIYDNLGYFQRFFDRNSISVIIQEPQATAGAAMDRVRNAIHFIPFLINYDGCEWGVSIRCKPPFFFKTLFPNGVAFHSVMQVYRYPR